MGLFLVREEPEAHTHVVRSHVNAMGFTESGLIGGSRGARPARAPPFAWHPSSLADLGGASGVRPPICLAS